MSEGCVFCDQSWMRAAEIFIETPHCVFVSTRDPGIRARAGLAEDVLPGSGAIVPIVHRTSVFELTQAEWADTRDLLLRARTALHDLLAPDGYLLGWNQGASPASPYACHPAVRRRTCLTAGCARRQRPGKQVARSVGAREELPRHCSLHAGSWQRRGLPARCRIPGQFLAAIHRLPYWRGICAERASGVRWQVAG